MDRGERPEESLLLRKAVNTLAIVPKSARITTLGRKSYNVLLYQAQEQGLEKDVFRTPWTPWSKAWTSTATITR